MPDGRLVIVGMNNPLSDRPESALLPYPVNCAGWRLWKMVNDVSGVSRAEYCRLTERVNLVNARAWDPARARETAAGLWSRLEGRRAVILGAATRTSLWLPQVGPASWTVSGGVAWCAVPHPSGLCREYNDPLMRVVVGLMLEEELERARNADIPTIPKLRGLRHVPGLSASGQAES